MSRVIVRSNVPREGTGGPNRRACNRRSGRASWRRRPMDDSVLEWSEMKDGEVTSQA